jgi:hypothetical protein
MSSAAWVSLQLPTIDTAPEAVLPLQDSVVSEEGGSVLILDGAEQTERCNEVTK